MKNYIDFRLYEQDMIYILNCIMLTKKILQDGNPGIFGHFFKKSDYFTYIYDLTNLQKLISYKANRELYSYEDNEMFVSHQYWLNHKEKNFEFLKGKEKEDMLKSIKEEIKHINQVKQNRILRHELLNNLDLGNFRNKFYKKFIFSIRSIDKRNIV